MPAHIPWQGHAASLRFPLKSQLSGFRLSVKCLNFRSDFRPNTIRLHRGGAGGDTTSTVSSAHFLGLLSPLPRRVASPRYASSDHEIAQVLPVQDGRRAWAQTRAQAQARGGEDLLPGTGVSIPPLLADKTATCPLPCCRLSTGGNAFSGLFPCP